MKKVTILVDGMNLYKICFEGVKSHQLQMKNIHAVWGVIKKLRGLLNEAMEQGAFIDKVIVFWDGKNSGDLRRKIYPNYKEKRNRYFEGIDPYYEQINVLQELLVYLGIINYKDDIVETDDAIAYYVLNKKPEENIFIITNDNDYFQLIEKKVYVFYLNRLKLKNKLYPTNVLINSDNFESFFGYNVKNVLLRKVILGDESDNIKGAIGFGERTIVSEIPMFIKGEYNRSSLLEYVKKQADNKKKPSKRLKILEEFLESEDYDATEKLINLRNFLFITEECKKNVLSLQNLKGTVDLKKFNSLSKQCEIDFEIKTDLDFHGDYREFFRPFVSKRK
jgi:5'-3' exonuclease